MGDDTPNTPDGLEEDGSPFLHIGSTRLIMLADEEWPQPVVSNAYSEREDKKAKRRIRKIPDTIGRDNLLTIFKLVSKELMDSSLVHRRLLDENFVPLQQLFTILDHIFLFGLKGKRINILGTNKEFFSLFEQLQKSNTEFSEITTTVKEANHIKTLYGKGRAWMRLAMMQKRLSSVIDSLINRKELLSEYYEPGAILLHEDVMMLQGLLVGLNCINFHVNLKDNTNLDEAVGVIDYSLYLSEASLPGPVIDIAETDSGLSDLSIAEDQNSFLEEHNARLSSALQKTNKKLLELQAKHNVLEQEHSNTNKLLKDLQAENDLYRIENKRVTSEFDKKLQATVDDVVIERETYQATREGLELMYAESQKRLRDEIRARQDAEREIQQQISMRTETEMATRLLERDIYEKQDYICSLKSEIDEINGRNIELNSKCQLLEAKHREKTDQIKKLEETLMTAKNEQHRLNNKIKELNMQLAAADETSRSLAHKMSQSEETRLAMETDLKIEREWRVDLQNKVENSQEKINSLTTDIKRLHTTERELHHLQAVYNDLKKENETNLQTLTDMANQLGTSKLKHEQLREVQQALKDAQWAKDEAATNCALCEKPFNIARRKHHCRVCGEIFCNECSSQKMMLPSSAKPERVCDNCSVIVLSRASKS